MFVLLLVHDCRNVQGSIRACLNATTIETLMVYHLSNCQCNTQQAAVLGDFAQK